jgi:glycosyltransferase involved in cell wall biosynthesis
MFHDYSLFYDVQLMAVLMYSKRTKPLILCLLHLPPPVHGAAIMGQQVVESEIIRSCFDLSVIPIRSAESFVDQGKIRLGKVFQMIVMALRLGMHCMWSHPNLVYFTIFPKGKVFYRDLLFVGIMKLFRVPRIYHLHVKGMTQFVMEPLKRKIYDWAFRGADVIILSPRLFNDISKIVRLEKCHFLPNGIPDPWAGKKNNFRKYAGNGPPRILFLSNLFVTKGPFVLLEALIEIKEKGIPFRASFAGAWESQAVAAEFGKFVKEAGLQGVVEYLGPLYGGDKERIFSSVDIFAFPTYYPNEAFPLVLLEAMSQGLPVVSTMEGAIPDIVQDNLTGFLVPRKDAKALANCLMILLKDQDLRKNMGEAGRTRYLKYFKKDVFETNLMAIFSKCLESVN